MTNYPPMPSAADRVEALDVRGRIPVLDPVTGSITVGVAAIMVISAILFVSWVPLGKAASPSAMAALVLSAALLPLTSLVLPVDPQRTKDVMWEIGWSALAALLVVVLARRSGLTPDGRLVVHGIGVCAATMWGVRLLLVLRRWRRMSGGQPVPILTSSPGDAVLLALEEVGAANSHRIGAALAMPDEVCRAWLADLCRRRLVRREPFGRANHRITVQGRKRVAAILSEGPGASAVNGRD